MGKKEKLGRYVYECAQRMKIPVLPPDVNVSDIGFVPDGGNIRAGLGCIEGIAETSATTILKAREGGPFTSITDLIQRAKGVKKLSSKVLVALADAGALDSIVPNRQSAVLNIPDLLAQERIEIVSLFENEQIADIVETEEYPRLERRSRQEAMLGMNILKVTE